MMKTVEIQKILVPVDFSSASLGALAHAEELAHRTGAELHLLYVIEPVVAPMEFNTAAIIEANQADRINSKLAELRNTEVRHGVKAVTLVAEGEAAAAIVRTVEEQDFDLVVMGTHGHSGFRHLLLGSRAERVVRGASCPVLTVGPIDSRDQ
ncbi:MAG: universal stress protein [Immundisolibacteraceae bacterium]|nr:universal stress protein [Immundisolibacteraceae bacterium]